jgi:complement component 1 Q subcomponent-binding protein, mitochondrial
MFRNVPRLAIKAARLSTSTSTRTFTSKLQSFRQVTPLRLAITPVRFTAAFNSSARQLARSEVDEELVRKLQDELDLEKEMKDYDDYPVSVKDYLETGPFEVC